MNYSTLTRIVAFSNQLDFNLESSEFNNFPNKKNGKASFKYILFVNVRVDDILVSGHKNKEHVLAIISDCGLRSSDINLR